MSLSSSNPPPLPRPAKKKTVTVHFFFLFPGVLLVVKSIKNNDENDGRGTTNAGGEKHEKITDRDFDFIKSDPDPANKPDVGVAA